MNDPAPRILGMDDHFFSNKEGFATTFCNLGKRKIHDVVLGRSQSQLEPYLNKMTQRDRTRLVVMDLSETYRSIAKKFFPNAMIVADRFHVVRLINFQFLKVWQSLDPEGRRNRGLISLMRRHEWKLSGKSKSNLVRYLRERPMLEAVYEFKQDLMRIILTKTMDKKRARRIIPVFLSMIRELKESPFAALRTLGDTLDSWSEEIGRMFRSRRSNGMTEGYHNKMETISRRACGFRNFQNFRLRVRIHCSI